MVLQPATQVSHTAVRQGQVRGRPGGLLLEALLALPELAGKLWPVMYCFIVIGASARLLSPTGERVSTAAPYAEHHDMLDMQH